LKFFKCQEPLTKEDYEILESYSFKSSILEGIFSLLFLLKSLGCTNWLKKWIALVLRFIREERNQFLSFMLPVKITEFETNYRQKVTPEIIENIVLP